MGSLFRGLSRLVRRPLTPRVFPSTGFDLIDKARLVEEETWEWYNAEEFYPVRIGEVFKSKYQVVGKLGYGGCSTAWLCRDLIDHHHLTLKIGLSDALSEELSVLKHLKTIQTNHPGSFLVRDLVDEFEVTHSNKDYQVIVHAPLAITLRGFREILPGRALSPYRLKLTLQRILYALDFLHTEAKVIHTDIQENNILLALDSETAESDLGKFEMQEMESPTPRKICDDRVIYTSRPLVPRIYPYNTPVLSDFGQARLMKDYNPTIDIMPYQYRAPEVIFSIPWDEKVDIWSVAALTWDLFENGNLFKTIGGPENKQDNIYHLAHMVALLGPPPPDFLERTKTERLWQWFNKDGTWKGATAIPDTSLESEEKKLEGEEKVQFLRFMRKMLKWKPEERESAQQLLKDPWLRSV